MRAAYALRHPDYANVGQYGDALTIDTATGLPELLAERDALRDALESLKHADGGYCEAAFAMHDGSHPRHSSECVAARATLAISAKGHPATPGSKQKPISP